MADRPVINRARSRDISSRYVRRIYRRATADLSAGIRFISATQRSSRSRRGLVNLLDAPRRQPNFFSLSLSLLFAIFFFFFLPVSIHLSFLLLKEHTTDLATAVTFHLRLRILDFQLDEYYVYIFHFRFCNFFEFESLNLSSLWRARSNVSFCQIGIVKDIGNNTLF